MSQKPRLLFVDAYDSFSENVVALLRHLLDAHVTTIKIDTDPGQVSSETFQTFLERFDAIVLGPGPGNPTNPSDIGLFPLVWKHAAQAQIPVLGICLGFQNLCSAFGLTVSHLSLPCHGHAKTLRHYDEDVFQGLGEITATCYNSLGVQMIDRDLDIIPDISRPSSSASNESTSSSACPSHIRDDTGSLESHTDLQGCLNHPPRVLAYDDDGYIMAVRHNSLPFWGFQFHPESCKSNAACHQLVQSWWDTVKSHNAKIRRIRRRAEESLKMQSLLLNNSTASPSCSAVSEQLRSLTSHVDKVASFRTLQTTCGRQQIADLCRSLSRDGSVAMLESTKRGRFSILAIPDETTWHIRYQKGHLCILRDREQSPVSQQSMSLTAALKLVEDLTSDNSVIAGSPDIPFWGGFVGFLSYEAGLDLLDVSTTDDCPARTVPDISLMWVDRSIVVDRQENTTTVQSIRRNDIQWLEKMTSKVTALSQCSPEKVNSRALNDHPARVSLPSHEVYASKIASCQTSLHAGNSYELCLTTSATLTSAKTPYNLYSSLQTTNPAPYAAYLHLLNTQILSSSPEQFLSWSRSSPHLDMMPMKGTLSKTSTINSVEKARAILLNPKEEAENLMIADLIRHDLHSVVGPSGGTVSVEKLFQIVETESLYQLISHIRGHIPISPPCAPISTYPSSLSSDQSRQILHHGHLALRSALPAGSMTGAPKKRSCEILRSLEKRNRGVYSGVIGYFDIGGGGAWSVAIRCAFTCDEEDQCEEPEGEELKDEEGEKRKDEEGKMTRKWHVGAGGAITVLSETEAEWEEMRAKMGAVLRGFGVE